MTRLTSPLAIVGSLLIFATSPTIAQDDAKTAGKTFSNSVVDIGIVVKDLGKSAKFYTEVLGLKELKGFNVPGETAKRFGLTDNQPAAIRVFVLDDAEGKPATKLKMMAFPDAPGAKSDQKFLHSTLGLSYLTLFVTDIDAAVARLKKAKVELLGETPANLGGKTFIAVFHDPDGNFIELIGPSK